MGTKARASRIDPAEYRRYLEDRLSRTRARIKMADAVTGLTIVAVTWVCYLLLVVMLDQIIELPSIVRFLLLVTCLIVTGGILLLRVILPSLNQVNTRFAARSIEKADQRMKNSVLSWVELSEHPEDLPTPILRTIENKAASDLSRVRIEDAIQPRHVLSALYVLASVVVLFCLYSFFTTKSFGASIERVLLPLGATAPPTATQLRITFDPGQADPTDPTPIPADSSITFKASVIRGNPAQVMAYLQADGSDYEEPHELARSSTVQSEFTLSLHQRQKTFHVRFVANDFHSKQYTIVVTPAPMITEWLLRYTPPSYTGEAPFTSPTPDITGLEGTEVVVEAATNLPVAANSARIEFKLAKPMASVDMKLMEGAENRIEGKFTLTGDGSYSVLFSDKEGRAPLFRPSNNIRVLRDLPPAIEFSRPAEVESSLPANQPLNLSARVKDDIGLRHIMLTIRKKGSEEAPIIFEQGGRPGDVLGQSEAINESVDLTKFKLIPGDVVEYWIEAEDNKLPASNTASTRADSRIVKITKPLEAAPPAKDGEQKDATQTEDNEPQKGEKADKPDPKDDEKPGDEPSDKNDPSADSDPNKEDQKNEADDAKGNQRGEKTSEEEATANDLKKESGKEGKPQQANEKKADEENANKLSDEDRRDLDKLREYFKKKEGSKETGNAKENTNTPSDSKNGEAATPSKENNKEQNAGPEDKSANKDQGNEPGESPAGPKKEDGAPSPDAKKPQGSKEESAEQKEKSEEKKNSEEQKSSAGSGDKTKSAGSSKSAESKENDAKPIGNGAGGSDEEKKPSETNEEKPSEANEPNASEKNETPATDNEKSPSEPKTGRKPTDENQAGSKGDNSKSGSKGQEKSSPQGDSSKSPGNSDSSQKSGESKDKVSSSDGEKSPNADEKASPKEGDKAAEEKQSKAGSEGKPNSSSEKQSSSGGEKQSGQESQSQSGESGSSDDSSEKDGKQNKESKEGKPTPGSEGENDKPSKRSTKVGNDESSAASKGNSDGSSQEGPSQSPGLKGPGSPSDQKGNESKGAGDKQRAEGSDKSTEGGEKGTPSEQSSPTDNKEKPSENQQSSEKQPSGEKQEEEKPSSSKDSKESGSKEGEQKGSESKSTASDGKQGSQGKPSNSGGEQKGSEGNQQSANSSSSKESKEGSPSKEASDSKSSDSSESSDKQSPPKDEEKSSDSKDSGSKESEQSKKQNEGSPKGSSSSNNNDSKDAKPADDSSKNGSADAHQTGSATQPSGGKRANPTSDKGDGGVLDNSGDQADPDDLKKGSNLILKKLQDQMANKKVDPDLLKSMGWTEEDARNFYERLQKEQQPAENVAPVEREQRRQFGQGTDLRKSTGKGAGTRNDSIQDLHSGRRTPVPPQVRKRFEAYMKSLSETSSGKPADKPPAPPAAGTK